MRGWGHLAVVLCACAAAPTPVQQAVTLPAPPRDAGTPVVGVQHLGPGDAYTKTLADFFRARRSTRPGGEACVVFQVNLDMQMIPWHVNGEAFTKSGDDEFDSAARAMLQRLVDERTPLPEPPPEIASDFRGKAVRLSQCR